MDAANVQELRAKAQGIVDRVRQDPEFAAQLQADPRGTLLAAGMPESALLPPDTESDVHGYVDRGVATAETVITIVITTVTTAITDTIR
jgi:hypothetical protein